ncbi:MAG: DUF2199 domain-containing protein [Myxococcota bacterium]
MTAYEIEFEEPSLDRCPCCDGLSVRLTRFVYRGGDAFAVYYVAYLTAHPEAAVELLISLGEWGEGSEACDRAAFRVCVHPAEDANEATLEDVETSVWSDVEIMGKRLTRADALAHPWKQAAFEVLDAAFEQDPALRGVEHRVRCGAPHVPLERSFAKPDALAALGDDPRVKVSGDFARLGSERYFVRTTLGIRVEHYDVWRVGLWVEVSREDLQRINAAWDAEDYGDLRFEGTIANDAHADLGLTMPAAPRVQCHVEDAQARSTVDLKTSGAWAQAFTNPWDRHAFESFAVRHHFL